MRIRLIYKVVGPSVEQKRTGFEGLSRCALIFQIGFLSFSSSLPWRIIMHL